MTGLPGYLNWLKYFLDPDNPFVPWMLVIDLLLIAVHFSMVYWVYRDALKRYNRGAPWAALAAVLPVAGWAFYLLYRISPLVQFDHIESQTYDETQFEWTDYDEYKANRNKAMFASIKSLWRGEEGSGYSPWVRASRARELGKALTPEEKEQRRKERIERRQKQREQAKQRLRQSRQDKALRRKKAKQQRTMQGAHGFKFSLSERRQRAVKRKMELMDKLKQLPRQDADVEELIYQMNYSGALQQAQDKLVVAKEFNDQQGIITYETYVQRIMDQMARESEDEPLEESP